MHKIGILSIVTYINKKQLQYYKKNHKWEELYTIYNNFLHKS